MQIIHDKVGIFLYNNCGGVVHMTISNLTKRRELLDALIVLERNKKSVERIFAQAFIRRDVTLLNECILTIDEIKIVENLVTSKLSNS